MFFCLIFPSRRQRFSDVSAQYQNNKYDNNNNNICMRMSRHDRSSTFEALRAGQRIYTREAPIRI